MLIYRVYPRERRDDVSEGGVRAGRKDRQACYFNIRLEKRALKWKKK